jgi:hypothetical protein
MQVEATEVLMQVRRTFRFLKDMGSAIKAHAAIHQSEKGEPDKESGYDHMADALGYLVWREFNPLFARSGKATGIRIY